MLSLNLKDGVYWNFYAYSPRGNAALRLLADAMMINADCISKFNESEAYSRNAEVISLKLIESSTDDLLKTIPDIKGSVIDWPLLVHRHSRFTFLNTFRIAQFIGLTAERGGGILIHGALAEKDCRGIVLAGPSGTGKSTASKRLPAPWNPLSDDTVLIVKKSDGEYWAHPWPTWSRINAGDPSGYVNSNYSVPLSAVFFLQKSQKDVALTLEIKNAIGMLLGCAEVATGSLLVDLMKEELVKLRQQRFRNLFDLVSRVPQYTLKISRHGNFWKKIEEILPL